MLIKEATFVEYSQISPVPGHWTTVQFSPGTAPFRMGRNLISIANSPDKRSMKSSGKIYHQLFLHSSFCADFLTPRILQIINASRDLWSRWQLFIFGEVKIRGKRCHLFVRIYFTSFLNEDHFHLQAWCIQFLRAELHLILHNRQLILF